MPFFTIGWVKRAHTLQRFFHVFSMQQKHTKDLVQILAFLGNAHGYPLHKKLFIDWNQAYANYITMQLVAPAPIHVFILPAKCNSTQDGQCSSDSADVCTPKKNITSNRWSPWWLFEGWINAVNKPMLFKILQPYHKELILKLREFPMPTSEINNPAT